MLALVVLVSTGCADGAENQAPAGATLTPPTTSASGATAAPSSTPRSTTAPAPPEPSGAQAVEVQVTVADGTVSPPFDRIEIPRGSTVRLTVTSDTADEVHVHEPYDLELPLEAGTPATAEFRADQPGLVEVELHESGKQLTQLLVT